MASENVLDQLLDENAPVKDLIEKDKKKGKEPDKAKKKTGCSPYQLRGSSLETKKDLGEIMERGFFSYLFD